MPAADRWSESAETATARCVAVAFAILFCALIAYGFWAFSYDDNFITYRYAENLAGGEGLVYNPGESVLGTSAPGYAVLLAAGTLMAGWAGMGVAAVGTVASLISLLVLFGLLQRGARIAGHPTPALLMVVAVAVLVPMPLVLQLLGAEAFVVVALVVLAADALLRTRRDVVAGLLVAVAMAVRLDAGLAAAALGLIAWGHRRRLPWAFAASGLVPTAAWLGYLYLTFGHVVPHTIEGKTALSSVPYTLRTWQLLHGTLGTGGGLALVVAVLWGLVTACSYGWHRRPVFQALSLWLVSHEWTYRLVGVWFAPWYEVPLVLGLGVLASLGAVDVAWRITRVAPGRSGRPRPLVLGLIAAVLLTPLLVNSATFVHEHWRRPPDPRYEIYAEAGRYLRDETPAGATVLAFEIGVLGFVADRPILDLGALVSPRFVEPKFAGTRPRAAVDARPDYIVAIEGNPLMQRVVAQEAVKEEYTAVATFRHPRFGGGAVSILRRGQ